MNAGPVNARPANDLLSDLQADLRGPALAPAPVPAPATAPALPSAPPPPTTPAFELCLTPLRWSRPGLDLERGVRLHVGPLTVGVSRR